MPPRRIHRRRGRRERDDDDDGDEEEQLQFGIRQARRRTAHEYRDSSSLTPAQIMNQEIYYHTAESMLYSAFFLGHILALLTTLYQSYNATLLRWMNSSMAASIERSIERVRLFVNRCRDSRDRLYLAMIWIVAYGELAWLYAEDLSIFVRRPHRFQPPRNRTIDEISRSDCFAFFRIHPNQLRSLYRQWRIPDQFRSPNRHIFSGEECFIIFLYHIMNGTPFTNMARQEFGGDPRYFTYMWNAMNDHLYETFYHKISGTSLSQWVPHQVNHFRRLIHSALQDGAIERTRRDDNGDVAEQEIIRLDFLLETFRIIGFLDDTGIPTARPDRGDEDVDVQRAFYSGYFSSHGLKCQVVYFPNGMIGSAFITEMRQNDNGVQNISGLNNYLLRLLQNTGLVFGGLPPALYCDGIFGVLATIVPRFVGNITQEQRLLNMRMSSVRQIIEHVFADHYTLFRLFWVPHYLRLMVQGPQVRKLALNSFFIQNCFSCLNGTRSRYFGQLPPTLEEYIPLEEILEPPPAVDLGNIWEFDNV